jgi:selenide,water dikinase
VLGDMPVDADPRVLVDFRTADDAGVYEWDAGPALVQTVDFFTPIVDDPYVYGQIAATNALSDVYAMGGTPLTALAIAAFPASLDPGVVRAIVRGGLDKLREAGVALLGGHTVQDKEIKFGYAVTGAVARDAVWTNTGARPGDALVLTKRIGTGIITTALKHTRIPPSAGETAVASMTRLNGPAAVAIRASQAVVHAATDVSGFGLLGHAAEMALASGCTLRFDPSKVPLFDGVLELALENTPGGGWTNEAHFAPLVGGSAGLDAARLRALHDPQTSGGLLVAVAGETVELATEALRRAGVDAVVIGRVEHRGDHPVELDG